MTQTMTRPTTRRSTPKTAVERKREQLDRDAAQGFRPMLVKVHDSQRAAVRAFIRSLDSEATQ